MNAPTSSPTGGLSTDPGPRPHRAGAKSPLVSRPVLAMLTVLGLAVLFERLPYAERLRIISPPRVEESTPARPMLPAAATVGEAVLSEESRADLGALVGSTRRASHGPIAEKGDGLDALSKIDVKAPPVSLEDPSGRALDHFRAALAKTASGSAGAITRVLHFGDSMVASDYISSTLRRLLQEQFGDAGHGFSLVANAWPSYFHDGVARYATSGWLISRVVGPLASDGWYGLGGVSFKAPPHLLARIGTATRGTLGRHVSRFVIAYVEEPSGGRAQIRIDGRARGVLDTQGELKRFATAEYQVPDGEHTLELETTQGTTRLFGIIMERDTPGVVLDAIGIQGARIRFLDKQDPVHFAEQLRFRHPDLLIYQFGANESADGLAYPMRDYHDTMRAVIEKHKAALPESSCLVVGAMDRGEKKGDEVRSLSVIPLLVAEQRRVAGELGCAFFDTWKAMGGNGSMPRWVRRDLGQADLTHPTAVGADIIGTWLFRALLHSGAPNGANSPAPVPSEDGSRSARAPDMTEAPTGTPAQVLRAPSATPARTTPAHTSAPQ